MWLFRGYLAPGGLAALAVVGAVLQPLPVEAKNNAAAIAGGLILGAAVGAAISESHRHPPAVIVPDYVPVYSGGRYAAFYPKPGYVCYQAQQACYRQSNGHYAVNVTWEVFGR